jgi:hypothetical protein
VFYHVSLLAAEHCWQKTTEREGMSRDMPLRPVVRSPRTCRAYKVAREGIEPSACGFSVQFGGDVNALGRTKGRLRLLVNLREVTRKARSSATSSATCPATRRYSRRGLGTMAAAASSRPWRLRRTSASLLISQERSPLSLGNPRGERS